MKKIIHRLPEVLQYYRLLQQQMLNEKKIIDTLIDNNQRYTKGILCEEILRKNLRQVLPKNISVVQGFINYMDSKSKQCDIILYDFSNYSPLLSVNDLVLLPIEAVKAVIEVKTHLTQRDVKKALNDFQLIDSISKDAVGHYPVRKYIVAFESVSLKTLLKCEYLNPFPTQLNQIFVLGNGSVTKKRNSEEKTEAYKSKDTFFVLIANLLNQIYFDTGKQGGERNPYENYYDMIEEIKIE